MYHSYGYKSTHCLFISNRYGKSGNSIETMKTVSMCSLTNGILYLPQDVQHCLKDCYHCCVNKCLTHIRNTPSGCQ